MLEFIKYVFVYFGFGVLIVFPIIWLIGFIYKSEKFEEIKDRLRFSLAILVAIGLWIIPNTVDKGPSNTTTIQMVQKWYPNAKNINVDSITESKVESNTYQAYVSFNLGNSNICNTVVTIRKGTEKEIYNFRSEGYRCN